MAEAAEVQTLDDLKDENEVETPEAEVVDTEIETDESEDDTEAEESTDTEASNDEETASEDEQDSETPAWMKGDDEGEKKFTDADIGRAKAKFKAKLEKQHQSELETLKAENEALKNTRSAPSTDLKMPSRDDYLDADDPDTAFMVALSEYNQAVSDAKRDADAKSTELKQQNEASLAKIQAGVDEHYERVVELAEKSGISADQYRGAELQVRELVDSLYPSAGDALVDAFISKVGEGSEKVFYSLGVNSKNRAKFRTALESDPTGIEASMFLGELKVELNAPPKRTSNTPAPADEMKGDKAENASIKALRSEYEKATGKKDMQAQFNIRRKAKAAGIAASEINKW